MVIRFIIFLIFILFISLPGNSQLCTTLGQNPSTAFPVCGTSVFTQDTVPYCGGASIPGPCSNDPLTDVNPFWYKFTCFKEGTLGFSITPNDLNDDYDWQLFDITGHDPNDVYNDASLFVACNWSGNPGVTGASSAGNSLENCAGFAYPVFSAMPVLKADHNYILLVSHFTRFSPSQNGYELSFGGGTANITDPLLPEMSRLTSSCDATQVMVKLNKKIKCSSIAMDGSDFGVSPASSTIIAATGVGCNSNFDVDVVMLTMSKPLSPGTYIFTIKNGTDGNTLLDNCDRSIPVGNNWPINILPLQPTPMDSLTNAGCAPQSLQLVFRKNIRCNSVAANGSDFIITGTAPVTILSARGNCTEGVSNIINIVLSGAIVSEGNYEVMLVKGTDGNTIIDECAQETPEGSILPFVTKDTVSAAFSYQVFEGCRTDTIAFTHNGANGINKWLWQLADLGSGNLQNPVAYFKKFGTKEITLSVSNGVCSDTVTNTILLDNELKAAFETNNLLCPEDAATFKNNSIGDIISYAWSFDNGNTSIARTPPPLHYPLLSNEKRYTVSLIVENEAGCRDTALNTIKVLKSCYIAVPNAFTPNDDGLNDYLYPTNAYKADDLEFSVYNRIGQLVFHTKERFHKWDGKIKGNPQASGVYVWTLKYTHHDTGKKIFEKGAAVLIR